MKLIFSENYLCHNGNSIWIMNNVLDWIISISHIKIDCMQLNEELCYNSLETPSKKVILHCKTITYLSARLPFVKTEGLSLGLRIEDCQLGFDEVYQYVYNINFNISIN